MAEKVPEYLSILEAACDALAGFTGRTLDVLEVHCPPDLDYAVRLSKIVSKLSPIIGNMIEDAVVSFLNDTSDGDKGKWVRQDPDFPDTIFAGAVSPTPGIEIKAWCPFATEITARFKASSKTFAHDQTNVAVLAWLPEYVLFGKPRILGVWIDTARNIAASRERHYHKPPRYLVVEPEDTSARTKNLQQTNTTAQLFQGMPAQLEEATRVVEGWGPGGTTFSYAAEYQAKLRTLMNLYRYRPESNFSKLDRIGHKPVKDFKKQVYEINIKGLTVAQWRAVIRYAKRAAKDEAKKEKIKPVFQALIEQSPCDMGSLFKEALRRTRAAAPAAGRPRKTPRRRS